MRYAVRSILSTCLGLLALPGAPSAGEESKSPADGYLEGVVRDSSGRPLGGVTVMADHSIFYNASLSTRTDEQGHYRLRVRNGSWHAFARHHVDYNGKSYAVWLHPDDSSGFGGEGAVRNFTWKLNGARPEPLSGRYGGLVTFDSYPGLHIEDDEIEFTFRPVGALIDGSVGSVLKLHANRDRTFEDLPMGRYEVSARYRGQTVLLRRWNSDEDFMPSHRLDFEPQIPPHCDNCAMLEYTLSGH